MLKRYFAAITILATLSQAKAEEWVVPADKAKKVSPFAFTPESKKAGEALYKANCMSCHGMPGKNNAIPLVPPPPDLAGTVAQSLEDGEFFYKITEGRGPMPSFKNSLSANDIWNIISYLRSFNDKYVQEVARKITREGITEGNIQILFKLIKENKQLQAEVMNTTAEGKKPIEGAAVKLFAKRYFGNLPIDEERETDASGMVAFDFPKDLPGDSTGMVHLSAKLVDEDAFGEVKSDTVFAIGAPTCKPALNEQRAMWNVVQKAPLWILFTYTIGVLTIWGIIFYILLQIRKIYILGKNKEILGE